MNVRVDTKEQADGSFSVVVVFTDVPDQKQAKICGKLVEHLLRIWGAVPFLGPADPLVRKH
jgi:hypothetical protein